MPGIALAFNLLIFLLACAGMMIVFLGGSPAALLVLLIASLPLTLLTSVLAWAGLARKTSLRRALPAAWHLVPQWLAVAFWLGVALIFCGEFALFIALRLAEVPPALWQHLPLLAGLSAAVAFLLVFAWRKTIPE